MSGDTVKIPPAMVIAALEGENKRLERELAEVRAKYELLLNIECDQRERAERAEAENAALKAEALLATNELRNIVNARWQNWDEETRTPTDFVAWAQSRARHTLAAIDAVKGKP